jgi:hypothetical protein
VGRFLAAVVALNLYGRLTLIGTISHEESFMGNTNSPSDDQPKSDAAAERRLRGKGLTGSEQKSAPDHAAYEKDRNPDTELRLDGEDDSLYNDGLDVEDDDDETLAGTRGASSGIKP